MLTSYRDIASWASSKSDHYSPNALAEFFDADEADAWLIAFAYTDTNNRIIVTYESSEPLRKSKIKIPDVCIDNDVQYLDTMGMFRKLGEIF